MGKKSAGRKVAANQALATARQLRVGAYKLNLVAASIRGKTCSDALNILRFSRKRIANDVIKVLESAIANAENNHNLDIDKLYVSEASVGNAITMKRWMARGRGRGSKILKPFSKLRIVVTQGER